MCTPTPGTDRPPVARRPRYFGAPVKQGLDLPGTDIHTREHAQRVALYATAPGPDPAHGSPDEVPHRLRQCRRVGEASLDQIQTSLLPAETINSRAAVCGRSTPRYADTAARPGNRRSNAAARLRRSSRHSRVCVVWGCLNTGVHAAARSTWKGPMEKDASQSRSAGQRELRRRRGERAFLFDKSLSRCLAEVQREEWELALSSCGGDTVRAARQCGLGGAPPG